MSKRATGIAALSAIAAWNERLSPLPMHSGRCTDCHLRCAERKPDFAHCGCPWLHHWLPRRKVV